MADITKTQVKKNIAERITDKTETHSITKDNVATTLLEILDLIPDISSQDFSFTVPSPDDLTLKPPTIDTTKAYFYCPVAGEYSLPDGNILNVEQGEQALIIYKNNQWTKLTLNTLAQDTANADKNAIASQYLAYTILNTLNSKISQVEKKIPTITDLLSTEQAEQQFVALTDYNSNNDSITKRLDTLETTQNNNLYTYERITDQANGKNTTFRTTKKFIKGSTRVYLNGQRYFKDISYTENENLQGIVVSDTLPEANDIFVIEALFITE